MLTGVDRRFALAYLILVIAPITGLAGVLKAGRGLTAPIAIGGIWKMHVEAEGLPVWPCGGALVAASDASFTISQSGRTFTSYVDRPAASSASGSIEGRAIKAGILLSAAGAEDAGCVGRALLLEATVDGRVPPDSMEGTLVLTGCPACVPAPFRAVRLGQSHGK